MSAAGTRTVRESGQGHVVLVGGIVVWTHLLSDAEALWRARAYLEGPYAQRYSDVASEWGWADWRDAWPGVDGDLDGAVRQVWGRWVELAAEDETGAPEVHEVGDLVWVESPRPGERLSPATVIELAS